MSVRPKVMTVFGVDNYDGPHPDERLWETRIALSDEEIANAPALTLSYVKDYAFDPIRKKWKRYCDLIYVGNDEWGNDGVVGLIQSRDFDSDTFRVLSMLYLEFYYTDHVDVPVKRDERTRKLRLRQRPTGRYKCGDVEFREQWLYPQGYHIMTPVWAFVAKWLLDRLGMETSVVDYKWMLVWEWS